MPEEASSLFADIPEEYFSECEEHLAEARRGILDLRDSVGKSQIDRAAVDDLFRSFHSIKGLSAMVGVREAEQLAHLLESFLGSLRRGACGLEPATYDALVSGAKAIEEAVEARRRGAAPADVSQALLRLSAIGAPATSISTPGAELQSERLPIDPGAIRLAPAERAAIADALAAGAHASCFGFAPTPSLAQRGIDVNSVRRELAASGKIVHASPQVNAEGQVGFAFIVLTPDGESPPMPTLEGIVLIPFEFEPNDSFEPSAGLEPAAVVKGRPRSNLVRVDLAKLDELMRMVGELVITRSGFEQDLRRLAREAPSNLYRAFAETNGKLERQLRDLREAVMSVRMVPIREVFGRMHFVVHDLARGSDKSVSIELSGEATEVDKLIVERMMDPLLHLVRNAVSHGLESTRERKAQGKESEGKLALRASAAGESVVIEVEDDGRGINVAAVRSRAIALGLIGPDAGLDNAALLDILCTPEFSTREHADRASGRGVGMATVRAVVNELGGALELTTAPGRGTCFTIRLPLTMAITEALIVTAGGEKFAIPQAAVREVLQIEAAEATAIEANELIFHRGKPLTLLRLARLFQLPEAAGPSCYVLVIGGAAAAAGLVVERVLRIHEIVVRPLTDQLIRRPGISGATELGDRKPVLILDANELVDSVCRKARKAGQTAAVDSPAFSAAGNSAESAR